jgi:cytochrome c
MDRAAVPQTVRYSTKPRKPAMRTLLSIAAAVACAATFTAAAADDAAAEALAKKSGCLKCHSVDKKKDGPSFKDTAAKYKGKPDAEQKLFTHLTTNPMIKIDGKEESHDSLKTKNDADVKNVIGWILSR